MATIQDIRAASSYKGDANLAGGGLGVANINTDPIAKLAYYTFMYNKSEYDQREKDTQAKIADLGELVAFDPNTGIQKDKEILVPKLAETIKQAADISREVPRTHQERIDQMYRLKKVKDEMKTLITHGTTRGTAYQKRKNEITADATLTSEQKRLRLEALEEEANTTDITTPIGATEKHDLTMPKLNETTTRSFDVVFQDGNQIITSNVKEFDPTTNRADAMLTVQGWNEPIIEEGTPEWNALGPIEQRRQRELRSVKAKGGGTPVWIKMGEIMNAAMHDPNMIDPVTNKPDIDKIRKANPMLAGIFDLAEAHNRWAAGKRADVASGVYRDHSGSVVGNLPQGAKADDYIDVDYSDGLSPEEIAYLSKFSAYKGEIIEKKVQYHGDANQLQRQRESDANANKRAAMARSSSGSGGEEYAAEGNIIDKVSADTLFDEQGNPLDWGIVIDGKRQPVTIQGGEVYAGGQKVENVEKVIKVPVSAVDASIFDEYERRYRGGSAEEPIGQKIHIENGMVTIRVNKGVITGVKNEKGLFVDRDTYQDITVKTQQAGETKYKTQTTFGIKDEKQRSGGISTKRGSTTQSSSTAKKNINISGMKKSGKSTSNR